MNATSLSKYFPTPCPSPDCYIVTCTPLIRRVQVRMTGLLSVDYTLALNYAYTQVAQRYLSFTSLTVHRCTRTKISSLH
jgi:hypothetical protein